MMTQSENALGMRCERDATRQPERVCFEVAKPDYVFSSSNWHSLTENCPEDSKLLR